MQRYRHPTLKENHPGFPNTSRPRRRRIRHSTGDATRRESTRALARRATTTRTAREGGMRSLAPVAAAAADERGSRRGQW
ncbi:hypothetical protein DAI22_03g324650 [Oryza sativa Japonica Group]|nr:hypothetical protein DAI22_03g324650 [Oryza sativa Japonica Group]